MNEERILHPGHEDACNCDQALSYVERLRLLVTVWRDDNPQDEDGLTELDHLLARTAEDIEDRPANHIIETKHAPYCNGIDCTLFQCEKCTEIIGACLGCADEHYEWCDECAAAELKPSNAGTKAEAECRAPGD
jgi:hypothetical protein